MKPPLELTVKHVVKKPGKTGGRLTTVYFSPAKDAYQIPIGFMKRSKSKLDIAVYSITHREITDAIIDAHNRGLSVRVIVDKTQAAGRGSLVHLLEQAGVPTIRDNESGLQHNKYCIEYNKAGVPKSVLTGSYNWTLNATERNRENQVIVRIAYVVQAYAENFEQMWKDNGGA